MWHAHRRSCRTNRAVVGRSVFRWPGTEMLTDGQAHPSLSLHVPTRGSKKAIAACKCRIADAQAAHGDSEMCASWRAFQRARSASDALPRRGARPPHAPGPPLLSRPRRCSWESRSRRLTDDFPRREEVSWLVLSGQLSETSGLRPASITGIRDAFSAEKQEQIPSLLGRCFLY